MEIYKAFWDWFEDNEDKYFKGIEEVELQEELFDMLSAHLNKVGEGLCFEFGPVTKENKRQFVLSADGIKDVFPLVIELVSNAPDLKKWDIKAFRQRVKNPGQFKIRYADLEIGYDDIYFRYIADEEFGVELNVRNLDMNNNTMVNCIYILLDNLLGEYDTTMTISWIDWKVLEEDSIEHLIPVIELRDIIDDYKSKREN